MPFAKPEVIKLTLEKNNPKAGETVKAFAIARNSGLAKSTEDFSVIPEATGSTLSPVTFKNYTLESGATAGAIFSVTIPNETRNVVISAKINESDKKEIVLSYATDFTAGSEFTVPAAKSGLAYNGKEQELIVPLEWAADKKDALNENYKVLYQAVEKNAAGQYEALSESGWSEKIPVAKNVGEYGIYYKISFKENKEYIYNEFTSVSPIEAKIVKATPEFVKPVSLNATCGDKLSDIKLSTFANGKLKWEKDEATLVGNAGGNKFNLIFVPKDGVNYNEVKFEVTVNVGKADNSFTKTLAITGWTYGEKANEPEATAVDGTVTFVYSDEIDGTYTADALENAGDYYVKAKSSESSNYKALESAPVKFTIAKKSIEGGSASLEGELTYNGGKQKQGVKLEMEGYTPTYTVEGDEQTDVKADGDYELKIKGTGNFEGEILLNWNILPAEPTVSTTDLTSATVQLGKTLESASVTKGSLLDIGGNELSGDFVWKNKDEVVSGSGYKTMIFKPTDANYKEKEFDVEVSTYSVGGGSVSGSAKASYTISFETNGGSKIVSKTVKKNGTVTEPKAPEKEGYTFAGWYTDSKLKNEYDFDTKVTKSFTLYGKWSEDEVQEPSEDDEKEPSSNEWKNPFSDVLEADWFFESVRYVNQVGLMNGMSEDEFMPTENITRGMLVATLYRLEGEPAIMNKSIPFSDVKADSYYFEAISWAEQNEIVSGVNENEFMPDENITREQIAVILYRYAKYKGYDVSVGEDTNILSYEDFADISEYAIEGVQYAVGSGIMTGKTESTFCPKDFATRAEIATVLERFCRSEK